MTIRLLAVGNDPTIAETATRVTGDTHQRQLKYAGLLDAYHMVTWAPSYRDSGRLQLADSFWVYPCATRGIVAYLPAATRTAWRVAAREQLDVVVAQDPFVTGLVAYLVARRFGLPLNLQFAADMVDNPFWLREKPTNRVLNCLAHRLIRRADTYRVVSTSEQEKLVGIGVAAERIWNLGWITDFGRFLEADGTRLRADLLGPRHSSLVLFAGRLGPQKDLATLLLAVPQVLADHPQTLFLLAGAGPLEGALRDQVASGGLSDSVRFEGAVPYERMPEYYAACDIFVLPSVYEGNARVLAEAAASGRPVVTTDVSGASDTVVGGETGFIVPVRDVESLAARLSTLLGDPGLAARMGRRARRHILHLYDAERLLAGFREMWQATARMRMQR